jgi:phosphate-selective porin OprO/OprP
MVHGNAWDKKLEYNLSVTNGAGANRLNANQELLYVGRAVWNPLGYYGYSEADILDSQSPNLTFGANGGYQVQDFTSTKFFLAGADVGFKYKGFSFAGEYYFRNNDPVGTAATTRDHGYYAQAGYFIIPRHFEVAARSSQVFLGGANNNRSEFMGGLNYFIFGHDLKLQADYAFLPRQVNPSSNAGDSKKNDHRFRIQLQSWF